MNALVALVPVKWRFEVRLALRYLVTGGGQTLLTVGAVAAGVIVIVFLTALIFGLQARLTRTLTKPLIFRSSLALRPFRACKPGFLSTETS